MNIGIIGNGFVGKATQLLLNNLENINLYIYDIDSTKCVPNNLKIHDLIICDIIFIAVPTPMNIDGTCNISIVCKCIEQLQLFIDNKKSFIVIRSTVPIGISDKYNVYFMPEFLTEKNWAQDFYLNKDWIFGIPDNNDNNNNFKNLITELINKAHLKDNIKYNNIYFILNNEAEMIKYFKNTYLALKVSYCNEIFTFCKKKSINYDVIKKFIMKDNRIGNTHLSVPGHDDMFGYGGTCFPKDINSLYHQFNDLNIESYILKASLLRNQTVDRPQLDWIYNKNRAVINNITNDKIIYLIAGGCSFIGSNICRKLLNNNNNIIICIDNLIRSELSNIEELIDNPRFIFSKQSIINKLLLNIEKIDYIINLACEASPILYQETPIDRLDTCYIGTKNLLNLAKQYNSRLLMASTSEIYGDPIVNIQEETYNGNVNCIGPTACYDDGKRIAETLCINYNNEYNTNICIARIFNTYGPYMSVKDCRITHNFINQCLNNQDITIYGDGLQTYTFCYIDDLIEGLLALLYSNEIEAINIGNNNEITVLEFANKIKQLTNSNSNIIFKNLPIDDLKKRTPCINKAKSLLNWNPKINIIDGLKYTIQYFIDINK